MPFKKQGRTEDNQTIEIVDGDFTKIAKNMHMPCCKCGETFHVKTAKQAIDKVCEKCEE